MTSLAHAPETTDTRGSTSACAADAIADGLSSRGFESCIPTHRLSTLLQVTNVRGAMCQLTVYDGGVFDWEYRYRDSSRSDPSVLAAMVMCILNRNHAPEPCAPVAHHPRMTLKGQIGRTSQIRACGSA